MKNILEIKNLNIAFSQKKLFSKPEKLFAVENFNLEIKEGEFTALIGESGCGKTLTALSVMKLLPEAAFIESGKIIFDGKDLSSVSKKDFRKITGKDISIIFQDPLSCLNPLKKVGIQIEEAAVCHGLEKKKAHKKVLEILTDIGISDPERICLSYPKDLSGGMMQRVLIAIAIINEPKLLIADEPTTAVDATVQTEIIDTLFRLNKKYKTALLLISHDLAVVTNICSKINIMYAGQIVESGSTKDILTSPLHPYTKALLATFPDLNKKTKKLSVVSGTVPSLEERKSLKCRFFDRCDFRKNSCITKICTDTIPAVTDVNESTEKEPHFVRCIYYSLKGDKA